MSSTDFISTPTALIADVWNILIIYCVFIQSIGALGIPFGTFLGIWPSCSSLSLSLCGEYQVTNARVVFTILNIRVTSFFKHKS